MYLLVKQLHVACVVLSLAGFAARGALMLAGSPLLQARFVRVAPHIVDTVLLASALILAWMLQQRLRLRGVDVAGHRRATRFLTWIKRPLLAAGMLVP